jgi:hypothetical protein
MTKASAVTKDLKPVEPKSSPSTQSTSTTSQSSQASPLTKNVQKRAPTREEAKMIALLDKKQEQTKHKHHEPALVGNISKQSRKELALQAQQKSAALEKVSKAFDATLGDFDIEGKGHEAFQAKLNQDLSEFVDLAETWLIGTGQPSSPQASVLGAPTSEVSTIDAEQSVLVPILVPGNLLEENIVQYEESRDDAPWSNTLDSIAEEYDETEENESPQVHETTEHSIIGFRSNQYVDYLNPLMRAAHEGDVALIKTMVAQIPGPDALAKNAKGQTVSFFINESTDVGSEIGRILADYVGTKMKNVDSMSEEDTCWKLFEKHTTLSASAKAMLNAKIQNLKNRSSFTGESSLETTMSVLAKATQLELRLLKQALLQYFDNLTTLLYELLYNSSKIHLVRGESTKKLKAFAGGKFKSKPTSGGKP